MSHVFVWAAGTLSNSSCCTTPYTPALLCVLAAVHLRKIPHLKQETPSTPLQTPPRQPPRSLTSCQCCCAVLLQGLKCCKDQLLATGRVSCKLSNYSSDFRIYLQQHSAQQRSSRLHSPCNKLPRHPLSTAPTAAAQDQQKASYSTFSKICVQFASSSSLY